MTEARPRREHEAAAGPPRLAGATDTVADVPAPHVADPVRRPEVESSATRLADATRPEVEARAASEPTILLVPLGATEQHGPHLPLGTDSTIAVALAETAAARIEGAVVAPLLPYGSSGEHQDFAGTLSIGAEATETVLVELARSATETFPRVVFVNAHGGNVAPLAGAVGRLRAEGRDVRAWSPRFPGDAHAGRTETSLLLALDELRGSDRGRPLARRSDRGRLKAPIPGQRSTAVVQPGQRSTAVRAELAEAGNDSPLGELIDALRAGGVRAVSPNGVLGDPAGASADEGRALLDAAIADLCSLLASRADGGVDAPRPVARDDASPVRASASATASRPTPAVRR
jgi:mycofactocin precursor peptide peptidase